MDVTPLEVELNQRIALAISPIAFLLLGMPLAIRTSRRETSVGLFLSVILAGAYFISIMILQALSSRPQLHPQLLIWIPNVIYQVGGTIFLFFIARR
jgi:lipopolysaccharide export system permease protein